MELTKKQREAMAAAGVLNIPESGNTLDMVLPGDEMADFEAVNANDLARICEEDAFANEWMEIRVATTTDKQAPPFAVVTVCGTGQMSRLRIPRGVAVRVKRMHVEVLARMRETNYTQPTLNMADPEASNVLIPQNGMVYPFEVLHDPHPLGREWLERLINEPTW